MYTGLKCRWTFLSLSLLFLSLLPSVFRSHNTTKLRERKRGAQGDGGRSRSLRTRGKKRGIISGWRSITVKHLQVVMSSSEYLFLPLLWLGVTYSSHLSLPSSHRVRPKELEDFSSNITTLVSVFRTRSWQSSPGPTPIHHARFREQSWPTERTGAEPPSPSESVDAISNAGDQSLP